jgi:hypothetical protein
VAEGKGQGEGPLKVEIGMWKSEKETIDNQLRSLG